MDDRRYRAFISYSHRDEPWARWLHRALESYRIPRKLVGTRTGQGEIPRRLAPIFRDRDELPSAADLPGKVRQALADSAALVVVCSPSAAASKWVAEEIREFRRLGRGDRIFPLIVAGDPQARDDTACFPWALLQGEDGQQLEPLAADARKWADGRRLAKLKLLSGILGIPLDNLRRRDLQKRQRSWAVITIAATAMALAVTLAVTSRIAAEKRRELAQELVGFKLSDLSGQLRLAEGADILGRLDEWSEDERAAMAAVSGGSTAAAMAAAMALRESGMDKRRRGDQPAALQDFRRSWGILAMRYLEEGRNYELLFELGQAEFWIADVLRSQGHFDAAAQSVGNYADISRRLLRGQPENGDFVLEMAYALTNLGMIEGERERSSAERALQFIQAALEFNQIALVLDPQNELYRSELEQSHANVADAQLAVCDLGGALHSRMESLKLAREFYLSSPGNPRKQRLLAFTLGGIAQVQENIGLTDMALDSLRESERLLRDLLAADPDNAGLQHFQLERRSRIFGLLANLDRMVEARDMAPTLRDDWEAYRAAVERPGVAARVDYAEFLMNDSLLERTAGDTAAAARLLDAAIAELEAVLQEAPDLGNAHQELSMAAYLQWTYGGTPLAPALMARLMGSAGERTGSISCESAKVAVYFALMRGDVEAAKFHVSYLLDRGYFEPGFIRICRQKNLCNAP